jgi:hypothetical protein
MSCCDLEILIYALKDKIENFEYVEKYEDNISEVLTTKIVHD